MSDCRKCRWSGPDMPLPEADACIYCGYGLYCHNKAPQRQIVIFNGDLICAQYERDENLE